MVQPVSAASNRPVVTIILSIAVVLALIAAGLFAFIWQETKNTLEADIAALNTGAASLEAEKAQLAADLTAIQTKFPPQNFKSEADLLTWVVTAIPKLVEGNSLQQHLQLQRLALADGHTWSVTIFSPGPPAIVGSTVIAGDSMYLVNISAGTITKIHTSEYLLGG